MFKNRKLISMLLTVSMLLTLFPFAAFAKDGEVAGAEQIQQGQVKVATTLPEAENGVVTLTQDAEVTSLDANMTYDLHGHKLTLNLSGKSTVIVGENSILTIKDSTAEAPNKGGTLELTGTSGIFNCISPQKGGTVNVENIHVTCTSSAFAPEGKEATVNITNCDVSAMAYCVSTNAGTQENYNVKINLKDSTFRGDGVNFDNTPVFLNVAGTLTMDNCTVIGDRQAVLVRAGDATITNSNITLTGKFTDNNNYESGTWKAGNEVPMAAVLVGDQNSDAYDAAANVTVTNTTVKSESPKPAFYVSAEKGDKAQYNTALTLDKTTVTGDIVTANAVANKTATNVTLQNGTTVNGAVKVGAQNGDVLVNDSAVTAVEKAQGSGNNVVINKSTITNALPEDNDFAIIDSIINGQQVEGNTVAMIGNTAYNNLDDAIKAAIASKADTTIEVLKDAKITDANYTLTGNIVLQKSVSAAAAPKIDVTVAAGEKTRAFIVMPGAGLTLDGVEMTVNGTKNADSEKNNDGTGIDLYNSEKAEIGGAILTLKNGAVLNLTNLERATIASCRGKVVKDSIVSLEPGTAFNISNIDGNGANGGNWTIDNATLDMDNIGSFGLSAQSVTVTNKGKVNVSNVGIAGMSAKDIAIEKGSQVSITESGYKLPYVGWKGAETKDVMTLKDNGSFVLDKKSKIELTDNIGKDNKDVNTFGPGNGTVKMSGEFIGEVNVPEPAKNEVRITYTVDGDVYSSFIVKKDADAATVSFKEPAKPSVSGYTFNGWKYGKSNVKVKNGVVTLTLTKNVNTYTFSADLSKNTIQEPEYQVNVAATNNGTVTVSPKKAEYRERVTITVKPNKGYVVDEVVVTDKDGDEVTVTKKADDKYTFTMPKSKVKVKVTFKAENDEPAKPEQPSGMPFVDVVKGAWYYPAVEYVYNNNLMNGTNGGMTFEPNVDLNRAMMAAVLYNMEGQPACNKSGLFSDVADGRWYTNAINWAASNNIVSGMPDGSYAPNQALTREQMASILYRYAEYKGIDVNTRADLSKFTDGTTTSSWAQGVVQWAVAEKLINGNGNELQPKGTASRAQVATVLMNFCENVAK